VLLWFFVVLAQSREAAAETGGRASSAQDSDRRRVDFAEPTLRPGGPAPVA
jgi:hypothetical protein